MRMEQDAWLIDRYFAVRNGELLIGGIAASELAADYGTPLFVYDASVIDRKWDLLRKTLPPEFSIYYSVKANPSQAVLKRFLAKGAGLEIASAGEFHQAQHAGCPPGKIVFAGPGKTESELELVLGHGIGEIHVESLREAERIVAIARRRGVRARVALRVNPGGEAEGGAMRMGGRPAPFGVDEENLEDLLGQLLSMDALEIAGIHVFIGTQILDFEVLLSQYRKGLDIARRAAAILKRPLSTLDFGGGLGIPYFAHEKSLDEGRLREGMAALIAGVRGDPSFSGTRFFLEPGRYLVGEAGVYVTRINDIKISRGKKFPDRRWWNESSIGGVRKSGPDDQAQLSGGDSQQTCQPSRRNCRGGRPALHSPGCSGARHQSAGCGHRRPSWRLSIRSLRAIFQPAWLSQPSCSAGDMDRQRRPSRDSAQGGSGRLSARSIERGLKSSWRAARRDGKISANTATAI